MEADEVAVVLSDGGSQIVEPDFAANPGDELKKRGYDSGRRSRSSGCA
jgi:hypothetical protein